MFKKAHHGMHFWATVMAWSLTAYGSHVSVMVIVFVLLDCHLMFHLYLLVRSQMIQTGQLYLYR